MASFDEQDIHLLKRSCRYTVPDDLSFVTLVRAADAKTTTLRFARERGIELDIPLSAKTLSALIHVLGHMYGTPPEKIPEVLEEYRHQGGPIVRE